jgi:lysozyme-like protein
MAYTYSQLLGLAQQAGFQGDKSHTITAIALAESRGDPNAININSNNTIDRGLLQINSVHGFGASSFDPQTAFQQAFDISKGGTNFSPWSTYNSGDYQQYINVGAAAASTVPAGDSSSGGGNFQSFMTAGSPDATFSATPGAFDNPGNSVGDPTAMGQDIGTSGATGNLVPGGAIPNAISGIVGGLFSQQSGSLYAQPAGPYKDIPPQLRADTAAQNAEGAKTSSSWLGSLGDWFQRGGIMLLAILAGVAAVIWLALETKPGKQIVAGVATAGRGMREAA